MWTPEARRPLYLELGLRVEIDAEGRITIDGVLAPPPSSAGDGEQEGALQTRRSSL